MVEGVLLGRQDIVCTAMCGGLPRPEGREGMRFSFQVRDDAVYVVEHSLGLLTINP